MTTSTLNVLSAFVEAQPRPLAGADFVNRMRIFSGTLYPILYRLEKVGWIKGTWETDDPKKLGRPRRKYYHLTALGERLAVSALSEHMAATQGVRTRPSFAPRGH